MDEWDTPFDESMLDQDVIVYCPDEELAFDLMGILENNLVRWNNERMPTMFVNWKHYKGQTCYFIKSKALSYGNLDCARKADYNHYIKCSFTGHAAREIQDSSFENILTGWSRE